MKRLELTTAILPWMRERLTASRMETAPRMAASSAMSATRGLSHSGFSPERMRSRKTLDREVFRMPTTEVTAAVAMTKASGPPSPLRRLRTKATWSGALPPFSKASVGLNSSVMPVKDLSNSSRGTFTWPRAGSLM